MRTDGTENRDVLRLHKDCQEPLPGSASRAILFPPFSYSSVCGEQVLHHSHVLEIEVCVCVCVSFLFFSEISADTSKYRPAQKTALEPVQRASLRMGGVESLLPGV